MKISGPAAAAAAIVALTGAAVAPEEPPELAPVQVSEDGHWFTVGGQPFFWLADTAGDLLARFDRADVEHYLDARAAQGFTVVELLVGAGPNVHGDLPGADAGHGEGAYWDHIDVVVAEAAERGLRIAMRPTAAGERGAVAYGRFLGERYGATVLWVLGGPAAVPAAAETWRRVAAGLGLGSDGAADLLLTSRSETAVWASAQEWLTVATRPCPPPVPLPAGAPLMCAGPGAGSPVDVRRAAYEAVFDGAAGHTYTGPEPGGPADETATQLGHLRALVESRPYPNRVPAQETIGFPGLRALRDAQGRSVMVYTPVGGGFAVDTTALSGEALRGWWFDPRTGTAVDVGAVPRSESVAFFPPRTAPTDATLDWVLVVDDAAQPFPPPGS